MKAVELIRLRVPKDVFRDEDWHRALSELSLAGRYSALSRALRRGEILRLKRGLYVFAPRWRKSSSLSIFTLANQILHPSCVSMESALSHHGLIPEAVHVHTSTHPIRKTKTFENVFGVFTYEHVSCEPFFSFVARDELNDSQHALIAHPLRALFDWVYVRRRPVAALRELEEDLRLDVDLLLKSLEESSLAEILDLAASYKKKNISSLATLIVKELP